jgi:hypothetical protein
MPPTKRLAFGLLSSFLVVLVAGAPAPALASGRSALGDTLAMVGSRAITATDLVERIEWMPWPYKQGAGMDSAKVRALQSLVGEALLAGEARRHALGDSALVAAMSGSLEKALVRDALYRQVVADVPAPSPTEVDRIVQRQAPHASTADRAQRRRAVTDSLHALSRTERAIRFMASVLGPQRAVVDSATFMLLADSLRSLMRATRDQRMSPQGYALLPDDVEILLARLASSLDRTLVELPHAPLRLGDVLQDIRLYPWVFPSLGWRRFAQDLSAHLKDLVAGELMAREGRRRHLDRNPDVQRDLAMWTDAWRAHSMIARVAAGPDASEDEAFRRFATFEPEQALRASEIDVEEILSRSDSQAREVGSLLRSGARFDSLARRNTVRSEWRDRGGRSGFFRASRHPELGRAALMAPLDSLRGPITLPEGSSVFRVRGKRIVADSVDARAQLELSRDAVTMARRSERVARHVASLAAKADVEFNYAALREVEIFSENMVTKRTLGFGGGMLAAPSLTPLWDWVPIWRAARTTVP